MRAAVFVALIFALACRPERTTAPSFDVLTTAVHVGDIDATSPVLTSKNGKTAGTYRLEWEILVHDQDHAPAVGAFLSYTFSVDGKLIGGGGCLTITGTCGGGAGGFLPKNKHPVTGTIRVTSLDGTYDSAANHDPDGDSDGTTLVISIRP